MRWFESFSKKQIRNYQALNKTGQKNSTLATLYFWFSSKLKGIQSTARLGLPHSLDRCRGWNGSPGHRAHPHEARGMRAGPANNFYLTIGVAASEYCNINDEHKYYIPVEYQNGKHITTYAVLTITVVLMSIDSAQEFPKGQDTSSPMIDLHSVLH